MSRFENMLKSLLVLGRDHPVPVGSRRARKSGLSFENLEERLVLSTFRAIPIGEGLGTPSATGVGNVSGGGSLSDLCGGGSGGYLVEHVEPGRQAGAASASNVQRDVSVSRLGVATDGHEHGGSDHDQ